VTLTQSDVTSLLDAIRAGGDIDIIRKGVELVLQALIEAEATEVIGAGLFERSDARTNQRNGSRDRLLTTKAGDVGLKIPKLRRGSFFPSILERRRRIDRALFAVVMEAYVHGVSTRKVDDLVAALGASAGISKSEVSRICAGLDDEMAAFRARALGPRRLPVRVRGRHLRQRPRRRPSGQPRRGGGHRSVHDRRARGAGLRGGRHRGRGLLDRVPPLPTGAGPAWRAPGDLRPPPGAQSGHRQGVRGRRLAALPRPLLSVYRPSPPVLRHSS